MKTQPRSEMYLVYRDNFWHCKLFQRKRRDTPTYTVRTRSGKLNGQYIELQSLDVLPSVIFDDEGKALEFVSTKVQSFLELGYHEAEPEDIKQSVDKLLTFKKRRDLKLQQKQNEKIHSFKDKELKEPKLCQGKVDYGFKILLAETWHESIDPKGYLLSEKLDGMRVLWRDNKLICKNNNNISVPHYFTVGWPNQCLDGEIWLGRGQYKPLISIAKRQTPDFQEWQGVKFMVFDLPEVPEPYKKRLCLMKQIIQQSCSPYLQLVQHQTCKDMADLQEQLVAIEAKGGEGIMLRDPNSLYQCKRSKTLLKVKSLPDDEALVIGYEDGVGRNRGTVGALQVQSRDNIFFCIASGLSYDNKRNPPRIGSVVTYKHFGKTKEGYPRFPIYLRIRDDIDC